MSATSLTWGGRSIPAPGGLPAVAVSLTGPSLAQARSQARSAVDAGADVLELRVDLLEETGALATPDPLDAATAAAQVLECLRGLGEVIAADGANAGAGAPLLVTCRTAAEGGRARLDDAVYAALLHSVLDGLADWAPERRPAAIDVEVQRGCLPQICAQAHALDIDVVASFHDFEATPADEALEEVLARMAREGADLAKIAVWPTGAADGGHEGGGDELEDSSGIRRNASGLLSGIELGDRRLHAALQVVPVVGVSDGSVQLGQLGAVLGDQLGGATGPVKGPGGV